jgi:hypothetical protein
MVRACVCVVRACVCVVHACVCACEWARCRCVSMGPGSCDAPSLAATPPHLVGQRQGRLPQWQSGPHELRGAVCCLLLQLSIGRRGHGEARAVPAKEQRHCCRCCPQALQQALSGTAACCRADGAQHRRQPHMWRWCGGDDARARMRAACVHACMMGRACLRQRLRSARADCVKQQQQCMHMRGRGSHCQTPAPRSPARAQACAAHLGPARGGAARQRMAGTVHKPFPDPYGRVPARCW